MIRTTDYWDRLARLNQEWRNAYAAGDSDKMIALLDEIAALDKEEKS